jgi:uncharacterized membrane protein YphA (DoxX/SURF4 family)
MQMIWKSERWDEVNRKSVAQMPQIGTCVTEPSPPSPPDHTRWRARTIACLRVAFGLVWASAAWFKWQPAFQQSFLTQIAQAGNGQAPAMQAWIAFWSSLISLNPLLCARFEASTETALAVLLILGLFSNLSYVVGILLTLGIWAIPEAFGGPYQPGQTTDIGTALPYALLFGTLLVLSAGRFYALDQWLTPRLGRLSFLATGSLHQ